MVKTLWSYHNPTKIIFGAGSLDDLPALFTARTILLFTTPGFTKRGVTDCLRELLADREVVIYDEVKPNPDVNDIIGQYTSISNKAVEAVLGLGGGSVMDTAKAMRFLLAAQEDVCLLSHLEQGIPLPFVTPLQMLAVPTTAGTGSEVTPFATLWDHRRAKKYSLSTSNLHPTMTVVDPKLTLNMPREVTVSSGLDALSHALEALWNRNAGPITHSYSIRAIANIFQALPRVLAEPDNLEQRTVMMEASLLAGLAISVTRTALAHSISYPITAHYGVPHGLACGFPLPQVMMFNATVDDGRITKAAHELGYPSIKAFQEGLVELFQTVGVGVMLRQYVPSMDALIALAPQMITPGRTDNNLRTVEVVDIVNLLSNLKETFPF